MKSSPFVLLVLIAPALLSICPGCGPDKAITYYNLGIEAAKREDYAEAARLWTESIKHRPDDFESRYNLGAALVQLKRYEEAEQHLRKAVELNSLDADAHQMLGACLENTGQIPGAKKEYEFALAIKQTSVPSLVGLARVALAEGQNRSAENHASRAVALDPANLEANMLLAESYYRNGDFNSAYGQVLSAGRIGTTDASLYFLTGKVAYSRRMYEDALEALRSARALGSATDELFLYLGLTHLALGDFGEAEKAFRLSIYKNRENAKTWNGLAETYIREKRWRDADEAVAQAARIDPSDPETLLHRAAVRMGAGDPAGAVDAIETLRANPKYPPIADYYLGHAHLRLGDNVQARTAFQRFIDTWEGDQALTDEARTTLEDLAP